MADDLRRICAGATSGASTRPPIPIMHYKLLILSFSLPLRLSISYLLILLRINIIVSPIPGKPGTQEVLVQGKQSKAVVEYLSGKGVPKKWIEVIGK